MKRFILLLFAIFPLVGCVNNSNHSQEIVSSETKISQEEKEIDMKLFIDKKELKVDWEENDSVKALKELSLDTLSITMHEYGGFEQTGPIGQSIPSNDSQMNVVPGDIVLYNGNAISVFYRPSSWSYTKLGHILLEEEELNALLHVASVTFILKGETK